MRRSKHFANIIVFCLSETHLSQHYRYHYDLYHAILGIYNWHIIDTQWTTAAKIPDFQLQTAITLIIRFTYYISVGQNCVFFFPGAELAIIHIPM